MTVIVKRHTRADSLNEVVNEPSVYKWVHGSYKGALDLSSVVLNPYNYLLMGEYGGVLFTMHQPGLYEAHTQVLPAGRGQWTLDMVNAALNYMFTQTDAIEITTKVPKGNLGARALVRAIHGVFEFRRENGWVVDDVPVYADIFALRIQDWMRTAPDLTEKGVWFHNRLEAEYAKVGQVEPQHPDDIIHDRYVGAAVEMIQGGQTAKALVFYNRWAAMAGYAPIKVVTEAPLVLDISNALLVIRNKDFWLMSAGK